MTISLPNITGVPVDRQIAARMAEIITDESMFSGVSAEQVADPKRRLKSMTAGAVLIDCIGVGVKSSPLNRAGFSHEYVTHAAIRCKLPEASVDSDTLDLLGRLSETVQRYFEETARTIVFDAGSASLLKAEPFVHVARSQLFGEGLFLSPIEFTWRYKPGA